MNYVRQLYNVLLSCGTFALEKSSYRKILKAVRQKKIYGQKSDAVLDLNIFHFSIRKCGHSCRYVFIYGALNIKQGRHVRVGLPSELPGNRPSDRLKKRPKVHKGNIYYVGLIFLFKELLARITRRTFKTW